MLQLLTAGLGQLLPVVGRGSRQLITQKPPILERNVTLAEVPPKAAEGRPAAVGQLQPFTKQMTTAATSPPAPRLDGSNAIKLPLIAKPTN